MGSLDIFQHFWPLLGTASLNILQIWSIYISNGWKFSAGPELNKYDLLLLKVDITDRYNYGDITLLNVKFKY